MSVTRRASASGLGPRPGMTPVAEQAAQISGQRNEFAAIGNCSDHSPSSPYSGAARAPFSLSFPAVRTVEHAPVKEGNTIVTGIGQPPPTGEGATHQLIGDEGGAADCCSTGHACC